VRLGVLALAVLAIGLTFAGIPDYYDRIRTGPTWKIPDHDALLVGLARSGLSIEAFARYMIGLDLVANAASLALASILLWRRPRDPMALFVALMSDDKGTGRPVTTTSAGR
jgi:hypothetical protein